MNLKWRTSKRRKWTLSCLWMGSGWFCGKRKRWDGFAWNLCASWTVMEEVASLIPGSPQTSTAPFRRINVWPHCKSIFSPISVFSPICRKTGHQGTLSHSERDLKIVVSVDLLPSLVIWNEEYLGGLACAFNNLSAFFPHSFFNF